MIGDTKAQSHVTVEQLAHLGGGHIAYVKQMPSEEARKLFPQVEGIPSGLQLFALLSADGTPIGLGGGLARAGVRFLPETRKN